ncbi:SPRY domain-containing protein [Clostridium sp. JNZ J1-5]
MALITWNPNDKGTNVTLSNNNLTATIKGTTNSGVRATEGKSSGKFYFECAISATGTSFFPFIGISTNDASLSWSPGDKIRAYYYDGRKYNGTSTNYGAIYGKGSIIGVTLDLDDGTIEFFNNGVSQGVAFTDLSILTKPLYPYIVHGGSSADAIITANFGATPFTYELPVGYSPYDIENASWFVKTKYLIQNKTNNNIYSLDTGGNIVLSPSQIVDESNYITNGFSTLLNTTQVSQLKTIDSISNFKLLMYTDDTTATSAILNYNCESYRPVDKANPQFDIVMYKE